MITTLDLLNQLRVSKQLLSDRQVAKYLELHHSTVNKWRNGGTMSDDHAVIVADMLGLDVDFILLAIIAERSKNGRAIGALERLTEAKKTA
ncbi:HTH cro/C1-type domain-containing protein [Vibrio crassostreae]|uniref:helix-turn-helix domain-containing protein n=1 Tax=Vibrio TaxID=662 RepID=UPI00036D1898|nr:MULTISPECIES: helix-turn-helix transcriptional regulator [Vibrio]OCH46136.1 hypothetical protein A6D96_23025 [Vibrio cyclitrophicus]MCG9557646.1 helix-turn-helix domain-containing protein [Vibrio kanaloae]CAK1819928.1 HTH cro/C1-type domain-containing protein [Vibrio crassostreae]CAK1820264.1 HTH cro/C1-type domain-containing protein [Vibrio crassostreae]CAK1877807.1 HTH cro/C1-type domain-containing protein [Vibrio crassostreae]